MDIELTCLELCLPYAHPYYHFYYHLYCTGRNGVCIICFDIKNFSKETRDTRLDILQFNQPKAFSLSQCVILCKKLDVILEKDLDKFLTFLQRKWDEDLDGDVEQWDVKKTTRLIRSLERDTFCDRFHKKRAGDSRTEVGNQNVICTLINEGDGAIKC